MTISGGFVCTFDVFPTNYLAYNLMTNRDVEILGSKAKRSLRHRTGVSIDRRRVTGENWLNISLRMISAHLPHLLFPLPEGSRNPFAGAFQEKRKRLKDHITKGMS